MNEEQTEKISRKLSWLLRHGAEQEALSMDAAGWVKIADVLSCVRITRAQLDQVVAENNKRRLQVAGDRVRCMQGHSLEGMPVTRDALERSWAVWTDDGSIWHGTRPSALPGIAQHGIQAVSRTHVHLAATLDSTVGKRTGTPVMLEVSPAKLRASGIDVFESPNGVLLARQVPLDCIVGVRAMSRKARKQEQHLREILHLAASKTGN